jgi:hypothetical protein
MLLDEFILRVENLRVDRARGGAKPYKPLLLLSVVALMEKGEIADGRILLDGALKSVFDQLLRALYPDWTYRADIRLPFRHLETDGIWRLVPAPHALETYLAARSCGAKAPHLLRSVACAEMEAAIAEELIRDAASRRRLVRAIATKYLPAGASEKIVALLGDASAAASAPATEHLPSHALEREIEEYLWRRWEKTPFARMGIELCSPDKHGYAGRQLVTPVSAIDLVGFKPADRAWWVFELKKGRPGDKVVGQVSRYRGWLEAQRRPRLEKVRGAIIAGDVDMKLRYAASGACIDLWTYDAAMEFTLVA